MEPALAEKLGDNGEHQAPKAKISDLDFEETCVAVQHFGSMNHKVLRKPSAFATNSGR